MQIGQSKTNAKQRSISIKALLICLVTLGSILLLVDDRNPIGIHARQFVGMGKSQKGTMNGCFALEENGEHWAWFSQHQDTFGISGMSTMASEHYKSIGGTFTGKGKGTLHVVSATGEIVPFTKFSLGNFDEKTAEFESRGVEVFSMGGDDIDPAGESRWIRRGVGHCNPRKKERLSCTDVVRHETDQNWISSPQGASDMEIFLGKWKMNRHGGYLNAVKKSGQRYELVYSGWGRYYFKSHVDGFVTKKTADGHIHMVINFHTKKGDVASFRAELYPEDKQIFVKNCDHTVTGFELIKMNIDDTEKLDL